MKKNDHATVRSADTSTGAPDDRVVVLAPLGRDSAVICGAMAEAGVDCLTAGSIAELTTMVRREAGAALLTEEALTADGVAELSAALGQQPSWSDLPVLLLLAGRECLVSESARPVAALRMAGNVTVLVRPVPAVALVTAVQSALRARRRQYEVRDLIQREQAARQQAETATRLKDEFLATVSHELRTPLSAILLWIRLLSSGRVETERMQEAFQSIEGSAELQSRLIDDLLDVSRMLSGRPRLAAEEVQLSRVAQQAVTVARPMADAENVSLQSTIDPTTGLIQGDADRIQQVIWNLLSNAIKFTSAGGCVSLDVRADGRDVLICVSDTGQGIAPEFLPHVFERFRQADASSTRRHGGLGLGLAITQQLVQLHGGSVDVQSGGLGKGTTFTVRLPRMPPTDANRSRRPRSAAR